MKVKIGLLGIGHLGKIHLKCLQGIDRFELVGFCETDSALSEKISRDTGLVAFPSLGAMLDHVEALDIVTPTTSHFELAKTALEAGKHVFIEKPVTATVEQAEKLLELNRKTGLVVQVGHVERFNPAMLAIRNLRVDPKFIEVHRLANFNPRGTDVSVVLDLMIHDLDILLKLVPSRVSRILANGVCLVSNTPDIGNARIEWENGCVANVTASRMAFKSMRKMRIFQPDAYIGLDFLEKSAQVLRLYDGSPTEGQDGMNFFELETANGKKTVEINIPKTEPVNAIEMELQCFADSILNGTPPEVGMEEALEALRLAFDISDEIDFNLQKAVS